MMKGMKLTCDLKTLSSLLCQGRSVGALSGTAASPSFSLESPSLTSELTKRTEAELAGLEGERLDLTQEEKVEEGQSKNVNEVNGIKEYGGPKGPEPTRYNDWEVKGRVSDF
mmetsp:Transcript_22988/g.31949  ORF Transcript_22988/g.31949 Transcript_22988/m.31949 type:complete len:112 (+) Transcript_22988:88-423(+)